MSYLYGASVQGIQGFIFETNKLREIVGASELVEQICTTMFQNAVPNFQSENLIIGAAGNIKYIFDNKNDCQTLVRIFPKMVMTEAPGVTISQAVVEYQNSLEKENIATLESKLRIQRNKTTVQHGLGLMITERSRRTGKSGIGWKNKNKEDAAVIDLGQKNKTAKSKEAKDTLLNKILHEGHNLGDNRFPSDINHIVKKQEREWIAVVHADGNNLGKVIMKMADELPQEHTKDAFIEFSIRLEKATVMAASEAFYDVIYNKLEDHEYLPIRPVILGGDDLTVIIRGDLAMDFTERFLIFFEKHTKEQFKYFGTTYGLEDFDGCLTACAGIAYIKPNYPFHYGVKLSEKLCENSKNIAKKINKNNTPSCISFHKVQGSFIENYKDIVEQELCASGVQFNYGPYFIKEQHGFATVCQLKNWTKEIKKEDAPKGPLRNWLSDLQVNKEKASQQLDRIKTLNKKYVSRLSLSSNDIFTKRSDKTYTHIFDVITLATIEKK
jgi:hypothetical protein